MRISSILLVIVASGSMMACASQVGDGNPTEGTEQDLTNKSWVPLVDTCVQSAIGAAAVQAFKDNNLQHLEGVSVDDGDLATEGALKISVTTGNDEDGSTTRAVLVNQHVNTKTGSVTCTVSKIDNKAPGSLSSSKSAFSAVVDTCTGPAIAAANKLSDNYWHLYGLKVDGDLAQGGLLKYTVTGGNDEDGNTDYLVNMTLSINHNTGKETCKLVSSKIAK